MMHINANAFVARRARNVESGRTVTVWHGHNTNTGEDIVWYRVDTDRMRRVTGKAHIAAIYEQIDSAIASGEAVTV